MAPSDLHRTCMDMLSKFFIERQCFENSIFFGEIHSHPLERLRLGHFETTFPGLVEVFISLNAKVA